MDVAKYRDCGGSNEMQALSDAVWRRCYERLFVGLYGPKTQNDFDVYMNGGQFSENVSLAKYGADKVVSWVWGRYDSDQICYAVAQNAVEAADMMWNHKEKVDVATDLPSCDIKAATYDVDACLDSVMRHDRILTEYFAFYRSIYLGWQNLIMASEPTSDELIILPYHSD